MTRVGWAWLVIAWLSLGMLVGCGGGDTAPNPTTPPPATTPAPSATPSLPPDITPSPTPCVPNPDWEDTYTVQAGDTLGGIAIAAGVTIRDLQDGNCLENRDLLGVGDVLRVPNAVAIAIAGSPQGIEGAVVFVRQSDEGEQDLWTVKVDGTALRRITQTGTVLGRASRSPDHTWVAYRVVSPFFPLDDQSLNTALPSNLFVMQADGTGQQRLVDQGPDERLVRSMAVWSSDGEWLAFTEQDGQRGALVVINRDGKGRQVLATGRFAPPEQIEPVAPAWSPDGQRLAFVQWAESRPALLVVEGSSGALHTLDSGFVYAGGPLWVPQDGEAGRPVVGYAVRVAGQVHWQVVDEAGQTTARPGGRAMVAPDLAWQFRPGPEGLVLYSGAGDVQARPLPPDFGAVSWGPVADQFVMVDEAGNLVRVDIAGETQQVVVEGGVTSPVWTEPLWLVLP